MNVRTSSFLPRSSVGSARDGSLQSTSTGPAFKGQLRLVLYLLALNASAEMFMGVHSITSMLCHHNYADVSLQTNVGHGSSSSNMLQCAFRGPRAWAATWPFDMWSKILVNQPPGRREPSRLHAQRAHVRQIREESWEELPAHPVLAGRSI